MSLHQKPVGLAHLQTGAKISFLTTFSFSIFFVIPPKGGEGGVSNVRETLAVTSLSSSSSTLLQRCTCKRHGFQESIGFIRSDTFRLAVATSFSFALSTYVFTKCLIIVFECCYL